MVPPLKKHRDNGQPCTTTGTARTMFLRSVATTVFDPTRKYEAPSVCRTYILCIHNHAAPKVSSTQHLVIAKVSATIDMIHASRMDDCTGYDVPGVGILKSGSQCVDRRIVHTQDCDDKSLQGSESETQSLEGAWGWPSKKMNRCKSVAKSLSTGQVVSP